MPSHAPDCPLHPNWTDETLVRGLRACTCGADKAKPAAAPGDAPHVLVAAALERLQNGLALGRGERIALLAHITDLAQRLAECEHELVSLRHTLDNLVACQRARAEVAEATLLQEQLDHAQTTRVLTERVRELGAELAAVRAAQGEMEQALERGVDAAEKMSREDEAAEAGARG